MIHDQADNLRELVRRRSTTAAAGPASHLITVAGGKGGVGTSTIAANLAIALSAQGRRTVLVEADLDRTASGLTNEPEGGSIVDALAGRRTVHEILRRGPGGIQILPGAVAPAHVVECSTAAQQRFISELKSLGRHAEAVVVDAGGGRNPFMRRLWQSTDLVLLVTTADPGSIVESYAAIKVLHGGDAAIPLYTLVNKVSDGTAAVSSEAAEVHGRVGGACRRFLGLQTYEAGHVPLDAGNAGDVHVGPRVRLFLLQSPRSEAARSLERVAEKVWNAIAPGDRLPAPKPQRSQLTQSSTENRGGMMPPQRNSKSAA